MFSKRIDNKINDMYLLVVFLGFEKQTVTLMQTKGRVLFEIFLAGLAGILVCSMLSSLTKGLYSLPPWHDWRVTDGSYYTLRSKMDGGCPPSPCPCDHVTWAGHMSHVTMWPYSTALHQFKFVSYITPVIGKGSASLATQRFFTLLFCGSRCKDSKQLGTRLIQTSRPLVHSLFFI